MDTPAPADQSAAKPAPEPVPVPGDPPSASPSREPTLAEVQAELVALGQRVDALAGSFEAAVRAAVAEEVQRVAGELQHTVATLGRVLVRDLGRLNQILTQHRDAILVELRSPPGTTTPDRGGSAADPAIAAPDDGAEEGAPSEEASAEPASDSEKGRHWRRRKA